MDAQSIALCRPSPCQLTCTPLAPVYGKLPGLGRTSGQVRTAMPILCQQEAAKVSRSITRRQVIAVPGEVLIATAAISSAGRETFTGYKFRPVRINRANHQAQPIVTCCNTYMNAAETLSGLREDVNLWLQATKASTRLSQLRQMER